MPPQRDRIREQAEVSGRRSSARRREWVWLFVVPTIVAVVVLLAVHAPGGLAQRHRYRPEHMGHHRRRYRCGPA